MSSAIDDRSTEASAPPRTESSGQLLRARLASILAIAPLGVWTFIHLWNNLAAYRGAAAWEQAVTTYAHPVSQAVTFVVVLLPLLIHTGWGLARLWMARPNNVRYRGYGN